MTFANAIAKELLTAFKAVAPTALKATQRQAVFAAWMRAQLAAMRGLRGPRAASAAHLYKTLAGMSPAEVVHTVAQLCH